MSDEVTSERPKSKTSAQTTASKTVFEIPNFELPAAIRDLAEKGGAQAKDGCAKIRRATEEMTEAVEASFATAAKGATEYGLKVIESTRANTTAAFDFVEQLA